MSTTGRNRGVGWVLALLLLGGALTACGVRPSGVIRGAGPPHGQVNPATSVTLYLVSNGELSPVRRQSHGPLSRADVLALLANGPSRKERARGLTSEVPSEAAPFAVITRRPGRIEVSASVSADELSDTAADQVVCTVAAMDQDARQFVTLVGFASRTCPLFD